MGTSIVWRESANEQFPKFEHLPDLLAMKISPLI
jgi:hypothetical protein